MRLFACSFVFVCVRMCVDTLPLQWLLLSEDVGWIRVSGYTSTMLKVWLHFAEFLYQFLRIPYITLKDEYQPVRKTYIMQCNIDIGYESTRTTTSI